VSKVSETVSVSAVSRWARRSANGMNLLRRKWTRSKRPQRCSGPAVRLEHHHEDDRFRVRA
jgi:hypothetical protein